LSKTRTGTHSHFEKDRERINIVGNLEKKVENKFCYFEKLGFIGTYQN